MLNTLGDVIMLALVVAALAVVPYKLIKIWVWPHVRRVGALFVMSPAGRDTPAQSGAAVVHVPVRDTGTSARTTVEAHDITSDDYDMPRVGRRLSDGEIIALLATQKGVDGARYRFTANQIFELVKGTRADVLDQVKAIRAGPPAPHVRQYQERLEQLTAASNGHEE